MTPFTVCLLLVCAADQPDVPAVRLYSFSPRLAAAIRGQSPNSAAPVAPSSPMTPSLGAPTFEAPTPLPDVYNPFQPQPLAPLQDPFLSGPDPVLNSPDLFAPPWNGVNVPQTFRFGLSPRVDVGYLPEADVKGYNAGVEMFELDHELRYNSYFSRDWVISTAGQFDYRAWTFDGNDAAGVGRLNLYRFGWDTQLFTPEQNGWQWQFQFTAAINSDLEGPLNSYGWNFDGAIVSYHRVNPIMQLALGAAVWNRIDNIVIPYAGVIITPDDRWEFRLTFPKGRISYHLGDFWDGGSHWLYLSSEYRVDSYQFDLDGVSPGNAIQYEDWRLALGLRSDHGWFDKYIEVAWVLGRNLEFRDTISHLDLDDSVMVRAGIRY